MEMARKTGLWLVVATVLATLSSVYCRSAPAGAAQGDLVRRREIIDVNDIEHADYAAFVAYLEHHAQKPVDYVVDKARDHDIVILGEMHEVRENLQLVSSLIEPLYRRAGVRYLATEFLRRRNTARANEVITGPAYDEDAVIQLQRDYAWAWGFREYMDVFRAIWAFNQALPPEAERFKVVGLDCDVEPYDTWHGSEESKAAANRKLQRRDRDMARALFEGVLKKGGKALVHTGYAHSFTRYRQPLVTDGRFIDEAAPRLGCLLCEKYGDRVFQICLHQWHSRPLDPSGQPEGVREVLGGLMEKVLALRGDEPTGFDVEGSPFADLRDRESYYFTYQRDVAFSDLAQGYVFIKPLTQVTRCTWVDGFIDDTNFEKARAIALRRGWIEDGECGTPQELDERMSVLLASP